MFTNDEDCESAWIKRLFLNESFSDCTMLVKTSNSSTRFPVHKNIISLKSEVLAEFLKNSPKEAGEVILMENINPDAVLKVLEHMYFGETLIEDWMMAGEVLKIAKRFKIPTLIDVCEDRLMNNINFRNICYIYQAAILNDSLKVIRECDSVCALCGFVILNTMAFRKANIDIVKRILSDPNLQIENEFQAFRAAWNWATYKCCKEQKGISDENVAHEMQPLLHCIRFQSMSKVELKSIPEAVMNKLRETDTLSSSTDTLSSSMDKLLSSMDKLSSFTDTLSSSMDMLSSSADSSQSTKDTLSSFTLSQRGKSKNFPSNVSKYFSAFKFKMDFSDEEYLSRNITLMRFSISTSIYLTKIVVMCERIIPIDGTDVSLCISNRNGNISSFHYEDSISDGNVKVFLAQEFRVLKAHDIHAIKVNSKDSNRNLYWGFSSQKCMRLNGVEMTVLTERCYGVSEIAFAKAS